MRLILSFAACLFALTIFAAEHAADRATDHAAAPAPMSVSSFPTPVASHPITGLLLQEPPASHPIAAASHPAASHPADHATSGTVPLSMPVELIPTPSPEDLLLDINTATAEQLAQLPGMDQTRGEMVVQYRATYGPFKSVNDLLEVQGISERRLELFRNWIAVKARLVIAPIKTPAHR